MNPFSLQSGSTQNDQLSRESKRGVDASIHVANPRGMVWRRGKAVAAALGSLAPEVRVQALRTLSRLHRDPTVHDQLPPRSPRTVPLPASIRAACSRRHATLAWLCRIADGVAYTPKYLNSAFRVARRAAALAEKPVDHAYHHVDRLHRGTTLLAPLDRRVKRAVARAQRPVRLRGGLRQLLVD